jgi:hypothetical protein
MTTLKRGMHEQTGGISSLPSLRLRSKALWCRKKEWIMVALNHYGAAVAYEQLSRLSDAELRRRGLSRETLARDVVEAAATHRFTKNSSSLTEVEGRVGNENRKAPLTEGRFR